MLSVNTVKDEEARRELWSGALLAGALECK